MAASTLLAGPSLGAAGANEKVVVGLIGHGNQGGNHLKVLQTQPNVEVACVCDPDKGRRENALGVDPDLKLVDDPRRILDDKAIDAVIIATPDHWHAPAALLELDAGKHVYAKSRARTTFARPACSATRPEAASWSCSMAPRPAAAVPFTR